MGTAASRLRLAGVLAGLAFLAVGIYRAGLNELPPPLSSPDALFHRGHASGERIASKSWSADYDNVVANQDQTILEVDGVHRGIIYRRGKPYLRVRATHMTINTLSHDFTATGPLHVETVARHPQRTFDMNAAAWNDARQLLTCYDHVRISTGANAPLTVERLTFNVRTGNLDLHHVAGPIRFK
jgi:hypothetical protein